MAERGIVTLSVTYHKYHQRRSCRYKLPTKLARMHSMLKIKRVPPWTWIDLPPAADHNSNVLNGFST